MALRVAVARGRRHPHSWQLLLLIISLLRGRGRPRERPSLERGSIALQRHPAASSSSSSPSALLALASGVAIVGVAGQPLGSLPPPRGFSGRHRVVEVADRRLNVMRDEAEVVGVDVRVGAAADAIRPGKRVDVEYRASRSKSFSLL